MKYSVKENMATAKVVSKNLSEFADAVCLASVSGYSIYEGLKHDSGNWYKLLFFAGLVIAMQASVLLVRHFNYSR